MRCRRLKKFNNVNNVVWFGSYGINGDGTAKFYNEDNIHDNFGDKQEAVSDSLTQHLSIIEQELWYATNYGLPLLEKLNSKVEIDAAIAEIVLANPDVLFIKEFSSEKEGHNYSANMVVQSTFGDITLNI